MKARNSKPNKIKDALSTKLGKYRAGAAFKEVVRHLKADF